jgi:hypothetical protein
MEEIGVSARGEQRESRKIMVKWIREIEFVESYRSVGRGDGGYKEDFNYFGELADI